jgi:hypothetical protein
MWKRNILFAILFTLVLFSAASLSVADDNIPPSALDDLVTSAEVLEPPPQVPSVKKRKKPEIVIEGQPTAPTDEQE